MKRDMDLIRELLLKLEVTNTKPVQLTHIRAKGEDLKVEGYTTDEVLYHLKLLEEVGFIDVGTPKMMDGSVLFKSLTWSGHEYLDAVRDPGIWKKTKAGTDAAGGFTLELVKDLAKGFIKKQIEDRTGIKI